MSESLDVHGKSFWSSGWSAKLLDEAAAEGAGDSLGGGPGEVLAREWTRAADVLRGLGGAEGGPTIGDVCSWDGLVVVHTDDDLLTMKGMDHLLPEGRGAGGNEGPEADELQVACFMALLSFLASRPEVLRVSPARAIKLLNAAAYHNVQSANLTESPMTDAGLDGTGEVIQIVDTGLDVNSCFFVDEDGGEGVAHGHYFEEIGVEASALSSWFTSWDFNLQIARVFTGGDFNFDLSRRKYFWAGYEAIDLDRLCPRLDCDDRPEEYCLGDDEAETLQQHGGVARGAQLAIFDILDDYTGGV
ncbi:conserved unknown protein [Ectocarpus siliculosus]|uniref:subtilisin n=1 Tax=Ectocarpus siliculosus TaxID=2880 RepID=D7G6L6_ECTSI|nr:conserved unknown protein [Ectocarpus siliculosus]|eukprot:CBJ33955.1 conserved unknown protein [Ectocarpus siliculosus]